MPRHKLTIDCDVGIESEDHAKYLTGAIQAFFSAIHPMADPQPKVTINPVEGEGEERPDLAVAEKKLYVPGQNGQPS